MLNYISPFSKPIDIEQEVIAVEESGKCFVQEAYVLILYYLYILVHCLHK